jgi:hypothetical protein
VLALALAGCGSARPAAEQSATYSVAIVQSSFPARQLLANRVELTLAIRNTGTRTIPDVAATLEAGGRAGASGVVAFGSRLDATGMASYSRPVWVVDDGPVSGDTAYANTWALGAIRPHAKRTFTWRVAPVKAGRYLLRYRLVGSTTGRSQLRLANGDAPHGTFAVTVSGKPPATRVTPDGRIVSAPQ